MLLGGFNMQLKASKRNTLPKVNDENKTQLIRSCEAIFDGILDQLKAIDPSQLNQNSNMWYGSSSLLRIFNLLDNHLAHHRGQMIAYLRLKGISAPTYIGW